MICQITRSGIDGLRLRRCLSNLSYATGEIQQWGGLGNLTIDHFSMDSNATSNEPGLRT